jgi:hypothetical protein
MGYRRFDRAADAVRYAIEDLPSEFLVGAYLEVNEERFDSVAIRRLYERPDFPMERAQRRSQAEPLPSADAGRPKGKTA